MCIEIVVVTALVKRVYAELRYGKLNFKADMINLSKQIDLYEYVLLLHI